MQGLCVNHSLGKRDRPLMQLVGPAFECGSGCKSVPPLTSVVIHACFDGNNGLFFWLAYRLTFGQIVLKIWGCITVDWVCLCVCWCGVEPNDMGQIVCSFAMLRGGKVWPCRGRAGDHDIEHYLCVDKVIPKVENLPCAWTLVNFQILQICS